MDVHENLIAIHQHGNECQEATQDRSREIAKQIVYQWDKHDKFRVVAGEDSSEPDEVTVSRALLRVDAEYGCEVRDPCGTIWEYAAKLEAEYKAVCKQIADVNTDRDEIWSREKHLLSAVHQLLNNINAERAVTPSKPGWRVVEMIRDILVDTIETHQKTVRETIERDKNGVAAC